jgi:Ca-activated chloride channel family protein
MVAELATCALVILATAAETIHARRSRRVALLAFGPDERPALWAHLAAPLRVLGLAALCWGLFTLLSALPKVHKANPLANVDPRHLVLVLDASPSMYLKDAGPTKKQKRSERAAQVMQSFFERIPIELYRVSVLAFYTEAKAVVVDTTDLEVVRNILFDLPLSYAFDAGATNLFSGLEEAAKLAKPWKPASTTVVIVSDGDTVASTGMPKMPASVAHVLVVGIGDANVGTFIDGHQSRQDVSTLRQVAARLGGAYHDGNEHHLSSALLAEISQVRGKGLFERLTRREYALLACALGALILALLPYALHHRGTHWRPGVPLQRETLLVNEEVVAGSYR